MKEFSLFPYIGNKRNPRKTENKSQYWPRGAPKHAETAFLSENGFSFLSSWNEHTGCDIHVGGLYSWRFGPHSEEHESWSLRLSFQYCINLCDSLVHLQLCVFLGRRLPRQIPPGGDINEFSWVPGFGCNKRQGSHGLLLSNFFEQNDRWRRSLIWKRVGGRENKRKRSMMENNSMTC